MHLSIRVLPLLLTILAACESREIYVPPPTQPEPQACPAAPAPEEPVCPQPRDPVAIPGLCAPPPVCPAPPEPPGPVELFLAVTPLEPLRAQLRIQAGVRGCTPVGVELLGEAGAVLNVPVGPAVAVDVASLTRAGPRIDRFGFYGRVMCDDGRSHVGGPFMVPDVLRATQVTTLTLPTRDHFLQWIAALPGGGWFGMWGYVSPSDPTNVRDYLEIWVASGAMLSPYGSGLSMGTHPFGTKRADHPWLEGTRAYAAKGAQLRMWQDYVTGDKRSTYVVYNEPIPAAAFTTFPVPAELTGWDGLVTPSIEDPSRVWVSRENQIALVELSR